MASANTNLSLIAYDYRVLKNKKIKYPLIAISITLNLRLPLKLYKGMILDPVSLVRNLAVE